MRAIIGIPTAAASAFCTLLFFEARAGNIEFEAQRKAWGADRCRLNIGPIMPMNMMTSASAAYGAALPPAKPMKIFDIKDSEGRVFAIEVATVGVSRKGVVRILRSVPAARIVSSTRLYSRREEFCEFEIAGIRFRAWEPSGDDSRYWIGTSPPRFVEHFASVREAFVRYVPPRVVTVPRFVALALVAVGLPACLAFRTLRPALSSLGFGAFMIGGLLLTIVAVIVRGCPGVNPEHQGADADLNIERG